MKYLRELYPPELLNFLQKFRSSHDVNLKEVDVIVESNHNNWATISVKLNDYILEFKVPLDMTKQVGAAHYYTRCKEAWDELAFLTFERMTDWLDAEYKPWIKNDTGHNIDPNFVQLLVREIERIVEILKIEN